VKEVLHSSPKGPFPSLSFFPKGLQGKVVGFWGKGGFYAMAPYRSGKGSLISQASAPGEGYFPDLFSVMIL
jgi:hypothetical protein